MRYKLKIGGYRIVVNHREHNGIITIKLFVKKMHDSMLWPVLLLAWLAWMIWSDLTN